MGDTARLPLAGDNTGMGVIIEEARRITISAVIAGAYGLTPREREITAQGRSTKHIAAELGISPFTVQDHLKSVFAKVGVQSRAELVATLYVRHYEPRRDGGGTPSPYGWYLDDHATAVWSSRALGHAAAVHETPDDLARLQVLLDDSMAGAGRHLAAVITPERRLTASQVCEHLDGMTLLALATTTSDGRPLASPVSPVDGVFYRCAFYFGSAPDSVRFGHITHRPHVSATHLPGQHLAVTVHGTAAVVDVRAPEHAGFRQTLLDLYVPRYGSRWENFLDTETVYARITATRLFTFNGTGLS